MTMSKVKFVIPVTLEDTPNVKFTFTAVPWIHRLIGVVPAEGYRERWEHQGRHYEAQDEGGYCASRVSVASLQPLSSRLPEVG